MTPATARDLLYNDIVPVESVRREHAELKSVLAVVAEVIEVSDVLESIAGQPAGIAELAASLSMAVPEIRDRLLDRWHGAEPQQIRDDCILGVERGTFRLNDIYEKNRYITPPIPNLYFTRDAAFVAHDKAFRAVMAKDVRSAEAAIMSVILSSLGLPMEEQLVQRGLRNPALRIEGGDVLVLDRDTLLVGVGQRTSPAGMDALIEAMTAERNRPLTVVVVELPEERATIHLDMIATFIGPDTILAYQPYISGPQASRAYTIQAPPGIGVPWDIREHSSMIEAFERLDRPLNIVPCGGNREIVREREQWFSACNSVALGPQAILVYKNNPWTLEALSQHGYAIHTGLEVLERPELLRRPDGSLQPGPVAVAVNGVELARGGGGPRCMTLPLVRDDIS